MGNMHIVTGFKGENHVTAADVGSLNAAIFGTGSYVLNRGSKFKTTIVSNNKIRVADGDLMIQGRHVRLNEGTYVDLTIENGQQGYKRNDLIVARYTKESTSGVEDVNLVVIKGTPDATSPVDPSYTTGDIINDHVYLDDMPLFRIPLDGLNVQTIVPLYKLANAGLGTNRNLLDNPWFTINQRGVSSWSTGYGVDRWINWDGGTNTVNSDGSITFTKQIGQLIEEYGKNIKGKTVTASIMFSDNTILSKTATIPSNPLSLIVLEKTFTNGKFILYANAVGEMSFQINVTATTTIKACKLEVGSVSTLVNDVVPNYAEELLKCQRYLYVKGNSRTAYQAFAPCVGRSSDTMTGFIQFPVTMRTTPILTIEGTFITLPNWATPSSISIDTASVDSTMLNIGSSGTEIGNAYLLLNGASGNARLLFSADL